MSSNAPLTIADGLEICANYNRYSTHMQRPASLEDQERVCRDFISEKGWFLPPDFVYKDAALSGTSKLKRLAYEKLLANAEKKKFKHVVFDDTSRLGRRLSDILEFANLMKHYGITVHFVSQKLHSDDPNFDIMLTVYGMIDQQTITRIKTKVLSGQKGRVLQGFTAGSWPYGYRPVVVPSINADVAIGRAKTEGTRLEISEHEATVVRRIFQLFVDGNSIFKITTTLNLEKAPSPITFRSKKFAYGWDPGTIKRMLRNEKYRGIYVWNMTKQVSHPTTGRITKELKPENERVRQDSPHLRIVSDELWDKATARLKEFNDRQNARVLGGYNRAKDAPYLYSGLLVCGLCGSKMKVGGKQGVGFYECPSHRLRRGCTNAFRIKEDKVAKQITDMLANQLFKPENLNYLVSAVYADVQELLKSQSHPHPGETMRELEHAHRECERKIENLTQVIANTGTALLLAPLATEKFEKKRIEERISNLKGIRATKVTEADLRQLVAENIANLQIVLKSDVPLARKAVQQHIKKLLLFPEISEQGRVFQVIGEIDLFAGSEGQEYGVLLGGWGTPTAQQHIDRTFWFQAQIYADVDTECPLLEPLCSLLRERPEYSSGPLTASEWAHALRNLIGDSPVRPKRLGYGAVARCFRIHRHLLEKQLTITRTINPDAPAGSLYQISLLSDAACPS